MNKDRTGQQIKIACRAGTLAIQAPGVRSVQLEQLADARGWVFDWACTPVAIGGLAAWTERLPQLDALHGLERLRRVMMLVREGQYMTAMQEAALLPETYSPLWQFLNAEVRRRG